MRFLSDDIKVFKREKENPYHDERGRFTSAEEDAGGAIVDHSGYANTVRTSVDQLESDMNGYVNVLKSGEYDGGNHNGDFMLRSINTYVGPFGADANSFLRGAEFLRPMYEPMIGGVDEFLEQAPKFEGKTFRGVWFRDHSDFAKMSISLKPGNIYTDRGYTSSSTRRDVATNFTNPESNVAGRVIFTINSKRGVYLGPASPIPTEREVMFKHSTRFQIDKVKYEDGGLTIKVQMSEIAVPNNKKKSLKENPYHDERGRFTSEDDDEGGVAEDEDYGSMTVRNESAAESAMEDYADHLEDTDRAAVDAIEFYTDGDEEGYKMANQYLRGGKGLTGDREIDKDQADLVKNIDRFLDNAPKFEGTTYRGIFHSTPEKYEAHKERLMNSKIYTDRGYLSSSTDKKVAEGFTGKVKGRSIMFEIKGSSGVYLGQFGVSGEKEVLFKGSSRFSVGSIRETDVDGNKTLHVVLEQIREPRRKSLDTIVEKENPYHDEYGRFTTEDNAVDEFTPRYGGQVLPRRISGNSGGMADVAESGGGGSRSISWTAAELEDFRQTDIANGRPPGTTQAMMEGFARDHGRPAERSGSSNMSEISHDNIRDHVNAIDDYRHHLFNDRENELGSEVAQNWDTDRMALPIQDYLRSGNGGDAEMDKKVEAFDKYLKNAPKYEGRTYRGIWFDNKEKADSFIGSLKVGNIYTDKAYWTATTKKSVAEEYGYERESSVLFRIEGKKGVLTSYEEREIVYARKTRFEISKIETDKSGNKSIKYTVTLNEIDRGKKRKSFSYSEDGFEIKELFNDN